MGVEKLPFVLPIGRSWNKDEIRKWNKYEIKEKKKRKVLNDFKWFTEFCTFTFLPAQANSNESEIWSRDKAARRQLHFIGLRLKEALLLPNHMVNYQCIREELNIILQEKCKHHCRINEGIIAPLPNWNI